MSSFVKSAAFVSLIAFAALVFFVIPVMPAFAQEGIVPCGNPGQPACQPCHVVILVTKLINFGIIYLAVPLAILMFMWAGFRYALSGGSETHIGAAKTILKNTVIGLLIVFGAYFIVDLAIGVLTSSPGGNIFSGQKNFINIVAKWGPWNQPRIQADLERWCKTEPLERAPQGSSVEQSQQKLSDLIANIARAAGAILMGLSVLTILYAAFTYLTSGGSEDSTLRARDMIIFGLIGIGVALLAFALPALVASIIG